MAISITQTDLSKASNEMPKTKSVYDNFDRLKSVVHYDSSENVDYVLKANVNPSGKFLETKKYSQIQVDVVDAPSNISFDSAKLRARIYKNEGSKVYETGFIYWSGDVDTSILNQQQYGDVLTTPTILKGNFSKDISNLSDNTTYNYRAYVRHEYGTNYSKVYQFNTIDFNSVFSIAGDRFSGSNPLTVNLSAINAGTGGYTYGWSMTGGSISFEYSVSGITITSMGSGYEPDLPRYILDTIQITSSGAGYNPTAETLVLINDVIEPTLSASFAYNEGLAVYGVSSVEIPLALSGYTTNLFNVTFSSSDLSTVTEIASGTGSGGTYIIQREFAVFVDNILQPSLSVLNVYDETLDTFRISAVNIGSEIFGFTNSSRTVSISTTDPVPDPATAVATGNIQILADYTTKNITHTYLTAGTFTAKAYAILGDQIDKEATRTIRVNRATNFTAEWSPVINSSFGNDIVGAYDFRNLAGGLDAITLNSNCYAFYDFSPEDTLAGYSYGYGVADKLVGGYRVPKSLIRSRFPDGGFSTINGIAGYHGAFAQGIVGNAAKFVPVGGYGESWRNFGSHTIFGARGRGASSTYSISMWINYPQFSSEPGSKIFSLVGPFFAQEYGITQSTTKLCIMKNYYYAEDQGDRTAGGYNGSFGYPALETTDPSKMLVAGQWNHVVITKDNGSNYKYYLNGQLALSGYSGYIDYGSGGIGGYLAGYASFNIGGARNHGTVYGAPSGLIDSVSIWQTVLNDEQVSTLYNSGEGFEDVGVITPIVGPKLHLAGIGGYINTTFLTDGDSEIDKTSLLLKFEGSDGSTDFVDSSLEPVTLSASPSFATISTEEIKFGTSSGKLVGEYIGGATQHVGGYIMTPAGDDYAAFGTGDFTIEWWEYLLGGYGANLPGGYRGIWTYGNPNGRVINNASNGTPYAQLALMYWVGSSSHQLQVFIGGYPKYFSAPVGGYVGSIFLGTNDVTTNEWVHRAVVKQGLTFSHYKNGTLKGSFAWPSNLLNIGSSNIGGYGTISNTFSNNWPAGYGNGMGLIGSVLDDFGQVLPLSGHLDDFRVTKGLARYASNFVPPIQSFPTDEGTGIIGTSFRPGTEGGFGETKSTISVTYPHTLVFMGNVNALGGDTIYQAAQTTKWVQTNNQNVLSWSRSGQGLMPYNGNDNQTVGYTPNGTENFYIAYSFLGPANSNQVRYYLQTPSVSAQGLLPGNASATSFNGFVGFGRGLSTNNDSLAAQLNINGTARLGMFINQGFTTHADMLTLFNAVTSGPASNFPVT